MTDQRPEVLDELGRRFRAAAAREIAPARRPRVSHRRRHALALAFATLLALAGIAVATDLISVGTPARDQPGKSPRYRLRPNGGTIAVTAPDPRRALPWGVLAYASPQGETCAVVGHVRGSELGEIRGSEFRPFEATAGGACGDTAGHTFFLDLRRLDGRSLVFGRARRDVAAMRLTYRGRTFRTRTGPGGAFLFVSDAQLSLRQLSVEPLTSSGRVAR